MEEAGDPYKDQMEECIDLIMQELKSRGVLNGHTLAYQVGWIFQFDLLSSMSSNSVKQSNLILISKLFYCRVGLVLFNG